MKTLRLLGALVSFGASFVALAQARVASVPSLDAFRCPLPAQGRIAAEPEGRTVASAGYSSLIALQSGSFLKSAKDISCGRAS